MAQHSHLTPIGTADLQSRLADWFRRWRSPLRKYLVQRGAFRVADLDDLAQEVFLRLLRYESRELIAHPQAYLFKIASNVAAEWALRAHHRLEHQSAWLNTLVEDRVPEASLDSEVVRREVARAITLLRPREQRIIKLHFEEGLSHPQIAQALNVSLRIVRRDFESSYAKLRGEPKVPLTGVLRHGCD